MFLSIKESLHGQVTGVLRELFPALGEGFTLNMEYPANFGFGDISMTFPFELAKTLRQPPARIAARFVEAFRPASALVERAETAGAGYVNVRLDRKAVLREAVRASAGGRPPEPAGANAAKTIVEHTNINPNKAAHVGHLRNAVLGDTLVRLMRFTGETVEVQNYIDNTGVQVADVVVGFLHLEKMDLAGIAEIPGKFDYHCWDLYARVGEFYERGADEKSLRHRTLKSIEAGEGEEARVAAYVVERVVNAHLDTMARLGITYDVLPRESDILHLRFWDSAFGLLKEKGVLTFEAEGPNAGCWVMKYVKDGAEDVKIMVRSNGTVTYTGKDVAYQLWKLGRLGKDFHYGVFRTGRDGRPVWVTRPCPPPDGTPPHPAFGGGRRVFNVIDARQSYTQNIVVEGVRCLGFEEDAGRCTHFSYEMVALSPRCAEALGFALSEEERSKPHVEVSGRRGLGVKADDLLDCLEKRALEEVESRNPGLPDERKRAVARDVAVGAVRYFLLKFTRNSLIVFDMNDALNFDGETGPYLQYSAVRARNILRKYDEHYGTGREGRSEAIFSLIEGDLPEIADDVWDLLSSLLKMRDIARSALSGEEVATFARYMYSLGQKFSYFYNQHRIVGEADERLRHVFLAVVDAYLDAMTGGLGVLGIPVPDRM